MSLSSSASICRISYWQSRSNYWRSLKRADAARPGQRLPTANDTFVELVTATDRIEIENDASGTYSGMAYIVSQRSDLTPLT